MSDETSFLAAISAEPECDAHRLVYADWLDEQGRPDRAAFIRVQVALAHLGEYDYARAGGEEAIICPSCGTGTSTHRQGCKWLPLHIRERELLANHGNDWIPEPFVSRIMCRWRRGFVDELRAVNPEEWLAGADAVLALHPVGRVEFDTNPSGRDWWDNGAMLSFDRADGFLHDRWPGVVFDLRSAVASASWGTSTATPIEDLRAHIEALQRAAGMGINVAPAAARLFGIVLPEGDS